jgi:mRNA-degrading endonuclease toxin of MazEF toxin-antitoxin module
MKEKWDFHRGDIYLADLGRNMCGDEYSHVQSGVRPVVVVQNDLGNYFSPTVVIVPITSNIAKKPGQPTHCVIEKTMGLSTDSIALGEQIRTIDKRQCIKYLGRLSRSETDAVSRAAFYGMTDY